MLMVAGDHAGDVDDDHAGVAGGHLQRVFRPRRARVEDSPVQVVRGGRPRLERVHDGRDVPLYHASIVRGHAGRAAGRSRLAARVERVRDRHRLRRRVRRRQAGASTFSRALGHPSAQAAVRSHLLYAETTTSAAHDGEIHRRSEELTAQLAHPIIVSRVDSIGEVDGYGANDFFVDMRLGLFDEEFGLLTEGVAEALSPTETPLRRRRPITGPDADGEWSSNANVCVRDRKNSL